MVCTPCAFICVCVMTLTCNDNFRSPRMVCEVINALHLSDQAITPRSPYAGELPSFRVYENEKGLVRETAEAVRNLLHRGIAMKDIVVLSGRDRFASGQGSAPLACRAARCATGTVCQSWVSSARI